MERLIRALRREVFEACTNAEVRRQRFGPRAMRILAAEVDARAGGRYRIVITACTGESYDLVSEYREVQPFERLSLTWRWDQPGMAQMGNPLAQLTFDAGADCMHFAPAEAAVRCAPQTSLESFHARALAFADR